MHGLISTGEVFGDGRFVPMAGAFLTGVMPDPERRDGGMQKGSKAGSKTAKARPRKTSKARCKSAPRVSGRAAAPARETEVARLTRELSEARQQQAGALSPPSDRAY